MATNATCLRWLSIWQEHMMGDPLWLMIQQVLENNIRDIASLFLAAVDAGIKIIDFGNAISTFRAKIGELDSKARVERMELLIQLQVVAKEALRLQDAQLADAYGEYAAAFQVSAEAESRLVEELKDIKSILEKREAAGTDLADDEKELLGHVQGHLQIASRLSAHLERTDATLDAQRLRADQQRNQLEALDVQLEALKRVLRI